MVEIRKLSPGDRILDYRILEQIGAGGFGEVFRAEHEVLGRVVAIKVPRDLASLSALRLEGVIQAGLDHAGIVKTLEISISHNPPYVVHEFVEGASLTALIEQGALPWKRAVAILVEVCDALTYAQKQGVVHGDIKPGNILIPGSGEQKAKITDFGLGRLVEGTRADLQISRSLNYAEEASDKIAGTFRYLAPEVQRGEGADERSDIYSLGVLLFEMLTGSLPEGRELPSEVKRKIPSSIDDVFSRCYVRKSKRYKSLEELGAALREVLEPQKKPDAADAAAAAAMSADSKATRRLVATPVRARPVAAIPVDVPGQAQCRVKPTVNPTEVAIVEVDPEAGRPAHRPVQSHCSHAPQKAAEAEEGLLWGAATAAARGQSFIGFRSALWQNVNEAVSAPEGIAPIAKHGFDLAYGVTTDGDPQHRVFATALPYFDAEAARNFSTYAARVFEIEKGLWEKEVTFVIATREIRDRDKVDWALRSFSTGWWRRRRVVLVDLTCDEVIASEYGCDPVDNELKKSLLEQLRKSNKEINEAQLVFARLAAAHRQRRSRLGTALTVFSTFCLLAVGLTFHNKKAQSCSIEKREAPKIEKRLVKPVSIKTRWLPSKIIKPKAPKTPRLKTRKRNHRVE